LQTICGRLNFRESELKNVKMIKPISDCFLSFSIYFFSFFTIFSFSLSLFLFPFPYYLPICDCISFSVSLLLSFSATLYLFIHLPVSLLSSFSASIFLLSVSKSSAHFSLYLSLSFYFLCHSLNLFISLFLLFPPSLFIVSFSTYIFSLLLPFHII